MLAEHRKCGIADFYLHRCEHNDKHERARPRPVYREPCRAIFMSDNKGSNRDRNAEHIDIVVFHHEFVYIFLEIRIPHTQREENQRVVVPRGLPDFYKRKSESAGEYGHRDKPRKTVLVEDKERHYKYQIEAENGGNIPVRVAYALPCSEREQSRSRLRLYSECEVHQQEQENRDIKMRKKAQEPAPENTLDIRRAFFHYRAHHAVARIEQEGHNNELTEPAFQVEPYRIGRAAELHIPADVAHENEQHEDSVYGAGRIF